MHSVRSSRESRVSLTILPQNVRVRMRKLTAWRGGLQDRRPGHQGVFKSPAYAVFHEYASRLTYNDVEVRLTLMRSQLNAF